jgi:hypothetical protein
MNRLEDLCINNIAESVSNAPDSIKEKIIPKIQEKEKEKLILEHNSKINFYLTFLVEQMIDSNTIEYTDFHMLFPHIDKYIIDMAISIIEIFNEKLPENRRMNVPFNIDMFDGDDDNSERSYNSNIDYDSY